MKRFSFPSPYTVVFLVIVLAALGTWLMPAGSYNTLSYDVDRNLMVVDSGDEQHTLPATQETLDQLKVNIKVEKLIKQDIRKPVAIPGTYKEVKSNPQGVIAMILAPIEGIYDAIDVILFVLVIGGFIKVFDSSGAFGAGISLITVKLKGRESWLIVTLTFLFALAGST
ncbi:MAG: YfcC family protein, partial [Bacteroidetes bacterium]|nr:YfcC family protein [Bacteroidota bacterium]